MSLCADYAHRFFCRHRKIVVAVVTEMIVKMLQKHMHPKIIQNLFKLT